MQRKVLILLCLLSFCSCFLLGRYFDNPYEKETGVVDGNGQKLIKGNKKQELQSLPSSRNKKRISISTKVSVDKESTPLPTVNTDKMVGQIKKLGLLSGWLRDPLRDGAQLGNLIKGFNSSDFEEIILKAPRNSGYGYFRNLILEYVRRYPSRASLFCRENFLHNPFQVKRVLRAMVSIAPGKLLDLYETRHEMFNDDHLITQKIFAGLASQDVRAALDKLSILETLEDREKALAKIAGFAETEEEISRVLTEINDEMKIDLENMISRWSYINPQEARKWVEQQKWSPAREKYEKVIFRSLYKNREEAIDWYMSFEGTPKEKKVEAIMKYWWGGEQSGEPLEWLEKQKGIDGEKVKLEVLKYFSRFSLSDFVLNNLETLKNQQDREEVVFQMYVNIFRSQGQKKATALINNSPYKAAVLKRLKRARR